MKRLRELNQYRAVAWERAAYGGRGDDNGGCFEIPSAHYQGVTLRCIASSGLGWDHISVSTSQPRCPTWREMEQVKRLFFPPNEVAMQLHVANDDHISVHDFCLHIWRPHDVQIPLPPMGMVA